MEISGSDNSAIQHTSPLKPKPDCRKRESSDHFTMYQPFLFS